jgi:hypothetical protein
VKVTMRTIGLAAALVLALAVPSVASAANWKENGTEITDFGPHWLKNGGSLTKSESLTLEGTYGFGSANGGITCSVTAEAAIEPGDDGDVSSSFTNCDADGPMNHCVVTSATGWDDEFTAVAGGVVKIVGHSNYKTTGFLCPKEVIVVGTITATPDNSGKFSSLALSGQLQMGFDGKSAGSVNVSGSLAVKPAATYGVGSAPTVALSGSIAHFSPYGGVGCNSVNGSLKLQPSGAGQLTALDWAGCYTSSGWTNSCGEAISTTSNSLPWPVQDEGTTVKVSGISFTVKMQKCTWNVSGTLTGTPNKAGAISNLQLSGTLNTNGQNALWTGELGWTPAGWYGL